MKKVFALILALVLCITLIACGNDEPAAPNNDQDEIKQTTSQEQDPGSDPNDSPETPKALAKNSDGLYQIYSAEDMVLYKELLEKEMIANQSDGIYSNSGAILMADIDMSSVCNEQLGSWDPIGLDLIDKYNSGYFESGRLMDTTFDGNGHTIRGLYISGEDCGALFFQLNNVEVRDLSFADCKISVKRGEAATLAAEVRSSTIRNVKANSDVTVQMGSDGTDHRYIGGIVAHAMEDNYESTIVDCVNYGTISTESSDKCFLGGIAGYTDMLVNIITCKNYGLLSCTGTQNGIIGVRMGGIVGEMHGPSNYNGNVVGCINYGTVKTTSEGYVGGIVGNNQSRVKYCVNVGTVDGGTDALTYGIGVNNGFMYDNLDAGTVTGDCACTIDHKQGVSVPKNSPSLTNGSLVSQLNELAEGKYWVQGDEFPIWSGLETAN